MQRGVAWQADEYFSEMRAMGRSRADIKAHVPYSAAASPHTGSGASIPLSLGLLWPRCARYYSRHSEYAPHARSAMRYAAMARRGIQIAPLTTAGAEVILFTSSVIDILEDDARAVAIRESRTKPT